MRRTLASARLILHPSHALKNSVWGYTRAIAVTAAVSSRKRAPVDKIHAQGLILYAHDGTCIYRQNRVRSVPQSKASDCQKPS